ncbi:hypothetical protein ACMDB5_10425 [Flavobacterium sp. W1B]|uniref:hypothetical protein n=1 Tax=Flavobacterium sp. W1B TaxID=3394146 RepID=UPI0039BC8D76
MQIKTFWTILIKIIGLWIFLSSTSILPQFFTTLSYTNGSLDTESLLLLWLILLGTIFIYILIIRVFLFKTNWIIEKLKLENNFAEERIDLNIKNSTVLTIAIIFIGGIILVESLPSFFGRLFDFFRQKSLLKDYSDTSWLIYYFIKIIIGYLLLTNGKNIAKYIEKENIDK